MLKWVMKFFTWLMWQHFNTIPFLSSRYRRKDERVWKSLISENWKWWKNICEFSHVENFYSVLIAIWVIKFLIPNVFSLSNWIVPFKFCVIRTIGRLKYTTSYCTILKENGCHWSRFAGNFHFSHHNLLCQLSS